VSGRQKWLLAVIVLGLIAVGGVGWIVGGPGPLDFASGRKVALADYRGADPTGVPPSLAQASLVQRGAYLARAADCLVCHTAPGGKDYAGGLGFRLPFGIGTLYSTNVTPDKESGIGNYSDEEFLAALRRGIRRDGTRLYPAMPYASYTYMTDADALAIKAYLFSLPPVHAQPPANTLAFPFDQRWGMIFWSALFNPDTRFEPNADQSPEWNRGAYLAEALAHCGECHTPRNPAFALDARRKFAGAVTAGWRAYNISADKSTGVGGWSDEEIVSYLSTGHAAGRGTASGPMGEAVDESLSHLVLEDIHAIAAYLRTVPPTVSTDLLATLAPPAPATHKQAADAQDRRGKIVFEGACVSCHGWTGESTITPFATLTGARAVNDPSAVNVAQIMIAGTKRHGSEGALSMPAFGDIYSDAEIAAVANYVTARFGNTASRLTPQDVADLRKQASQ
jgi:mono/diheme cytochrome c family protein